MHDFIINAHHVVILVVWIIRVLHLVSHLAVDNQPDRNLFVPTFAPRAREARSCTLLDDFVNKLRVDVKVKECRLQILNLGPSEGVKLRVCHAVAVVEDAPAASTKRAERCGDDNTRWALSWGIKMREHRWGLT
eukprot:scaffold141906_cov31-Tisochrysis_lutea.AAC.2